jgi:hypothetical protein
MPLGDPDQELSLAAAEVEHAGAGCKVEARDQLVELRRRDRVHQGDAVVRRSW